MMGCDSDFWESMREVCCMGSTCDVCVIEDDASMAKLIVAVLTRAGYTCLSAGDASRGWELIEQNHPKVVVSDWELPGDDGLNLCQRLRSNADLSTTFFIMVTGCQDVEKRTMALNNGVDDYLIKPVDHGFLLARVRAGVRMWEVNERLRQAAITDGLTKLYNHDHLVTVLEAELKRAHRYGGRLSLIMIDLDFFKAINDTYGHLAGNEALVEVARVLRENVRDVDTVGRFGGEEFAIVAPEATIEQAVAIAERMRHGIADTVSIEAIGNHSVTASFGIATADDARVRSIADLIDLADRALYTAKSDGRNCVRTVFEIGEDEEHIAIEGAEIEGLRKKVALLSVKAKEVYVQTVSSLLQALEEKDPFTARHSLNVSYYAEQIARTMGLSEPLCVSIRNAGLLHDVGKVGIPDRILMKPTQLTAVEEKVMRQVPAISVRIIDYLRILESEMHLIRHQSEYHDGSGYPDGLHGDQIPVGSRVLLVANAFDAMTTDRLYRSCRTIEDTLVELRACAGKQFAPDVVEALHAFVQAHRNDVRKRVRETTDALRIPVHAF